MIETKLSIKNLGTQTKIDQIDIETYLDAYQYVYTKRHSHDEQKTIVYNIQADLSNAVDIFKNKVSFVSITFPLKEEQEKKAQKLKEKEDQRSNLGQGTEKKERIKTYVPKGRATITLPISLLTKLSEQPQTLSKTIEAALEAYLT